MDDIDEELKKARTAGFPIDVARGEGKSVNAASILGVISLGANQGDEVTITADGAEAAVMDVLDRLEEILLTDHDAS